MRQRIKDSKNVKKIGKPLMPQVGFKKIEKVKETKVKRTEEEEDYYRYMGMHLND